MGAAAPVGVAFRTFFGTVGSMGTLEGMLDEAPSFSVAGDAGALAASVVTLGGYSGGSRGRYTRARAAGGTFEIELREDGSFSAWVLGDVFARGALAPAPDPGLKGSVVQGAGLAIGAMIAALVVALVFGGK